MKKIGCGLFAIFFAGLVILCAYFWDNLVENESSSINENFTKAEHSIDDTKLDDKKNQLPKHLFPEGLYKLIGKKATEVKRKYGTPSRIDLSAYDYEWWVYPLTNSYLQIGVEDDQVVTVYYIGEVDPITAPFYIGQPYEELQQQYKFQDQISFNIQNNSYKFQLSSEEINTRPLIKVDNMFIQLYFDTFTNKLSGIRYLDGKTLIKQRPYSVIYRGELIEAKPLAANEWRKIEKGTALQILAITNEIRKRHQLNELYWDEKTAVVAFQHSEDMRNNNYFAHTSPTYGKLKDRLKKQRILYQLAGENIAAKYVDSIAVVEGWLNSEGHRVNLLHDEFTHLGVGVYEKYYTQNFITPW